MNQSDAWLSTEEAAARCGMTASWVREQIVNRRLRAISWEVGGRRTYRIRLDDWNAFVDEFSTPTDDPEWE